MDAILDLSLGSRPPTLSVRPSPLPAGEPEFVAHGDSFVRLSSREALSRWLALHPQGTAFVWRDRDLFGKDEARWLPGESERHFQETREYLRSRKMELELRE